MSKRGRFITRALVIGLVFLALLIGGVLPNSAYGLPYAANPSVDLPDRVLVKFHKDVSAAERQAVHKQNGGTVIGTFPGIDVDVV
jgi:hypothetical protein